MSEYIVGFVVVALVVAMFATNAVLSSLLRKQAHDHNLFVGELENKLLSTVPAPSGKSVGDNLIAAKQNLALIHAEMVQAEAGDDGKPIGEAVEQALADGVSVEDIFGQVRNLDAELGLGR